MTLRQERVRKRVAHKVRTERLRRRLTQRDLASFIGVAPSTLHGWETAKYPIPAEYLEDLALVLQTSFEFRGARKSKAVA